jgi:hypothetical protein
MFRKHQPARVLPRMPLTILPGSPDVLGASAHAFRHASSIFESKRDGTFQHDERFGLRGIAVPMRRDVRAPDHHVQEPMGVVVHARVEIVISAQSRRLAGALNE